MNAHNQSRMGLNPLPGEKPETPPPTMTATLPPLDEPEPWTPELPHPQASSPASSSVPTSTARRITDAPAPQDTGWSIPDLAAAPVSSKIMGVVILILLMVVGGLTLRPAPTPLRAATVAPTAETAPLLPLANPAPALPSAPALTAAPLPSPASPQEIAQEFFQTYKDGGGRAVVDKYGATLPKDDIDLLPSYLRNPEAMNVNGNGDSETWVEGVVDALTKGGDWTTNRYMMKIEHHQVTGFLATPPGMN